MQPCTLRKASATLSYVVTLFFQLILLLARSTYLKSIHEIGLQLVSIGSIESNRLVRKY